MSGYTKDPQFQATFAKMLQKRRPAGKGHDFNRIGQALAGAKGKNNTKATPRTPTHQQVNPTAAALQHQVRNRSAEQRASSAVITPNAGRGNSTNTSSAVAMLIKGRQ